MTAVKLRDSSDSDSLDTRRTDQGNRNPYMNDITPRNAAVIRRHLDWFTRTGATTASITSRRDNLRRLAAALPVALLDVTPDHLDAWQSDLARRRHQRRAGGLTVNTIGTYTAHTRAFYRWALDAEIIEHDPSARLPRPRRPRGTAHPIPPKDFDLALAVAPEPIRTWLLLGALMGLRAMEIAQLRRDSVDEVGGRLIVSGIGKGRKPFRLVVPTAVEPALRQHLHVASGPLWTTPRGGVLTPAALSGIVRRFFLRQGMPYTMHWARHSYGRDLYAVTRDVLVTQEGMRHESPNTTRIYVPTSSKAVVSAGDRLARRALEGRRRGGRPREDGSAAAAA
jgi:integrase/recombinase XerC